MSSPLAGAEMITFFAPASRCPRAASPVLNLPVDSSTMSTPRSRHGSSAGLRSARNLIALSPARMVSPDTDTSIGRTPSTVSYLSRCAIVAMLPRSLAAMISMPRSPSAAFTARQKLRPMRPNPLIPTRIVTVLSLLVGPLIASAPRLSDLTPGITRDLRPENHRGFDADPRGAHLGPVADRQGQTPEV